jgi:hypothetical protein
MNLQLFISLRSHRNEIHLENKRFRARAFLTKAFLFFTRRNNKDQALLHLWKDSVNIALQRHHFSASTQKKEDFVISVSVFPLWSQAVTTRFFIHLLSHVLQNPEPVASFCRTRHLQASRLGLSTSHRSISSESKISLISRSSSNPTIGLPSRPPTPAHLERISSTSYTFTQNGTCLSSGNSWLSTLSSVEEPAST